MSTFPSIVTTLTNPNATDRLNSPSHSSIHSAANSEITQIETFIGTLSSVAGTLVYDIRAAASNGGGHVQTANKGGTGQTSFTKGDLLVATSSSVLTKFAVGSVTGNLLYADTTTATGMKWGNAFANKVQINTASVLITAGNASVATTLFTATIPGSTLSAGQAVRYKGYVKNFAGNSDYRLVASYGGAVISSVLVGVTSSVVVSTGFIEGVIAANGTISSQIGYISIDMSGNVIGSGVPTGKVFMTNTGNTAVDASANQTLTITGQTQTGDPTSSVQTGIFTVEKLA